MKRTFVLFCIAFGLASCGDGQGIVLVRVGTSDAVTEAVASLQATVTPASGSVQVFNFPIAAAPSSVLRTSFSLSFDAASKGNVTIAVAARNASGTTLASGTMSTTVVPSSQVTLELTLNVVGTASCSDILSCYSTTMGGATCRDDPGCTARCDARGRMARYGTDARAYDQCETAAFSGACSTQCSGDFSMCTPCVDGTCTGGPPTESCTGGPCSAQRTACDNDL